MKKLNKKGMTLTEIIVSMALISIVLVFIFQLLIVLRYDDNLSKNKTTNAVNQGLVMKNIQNDLIYKKPSEIKLCGDVCYEFTFYDNSTTKLEINETSLKYDNELYKLDGSAKYILDEIEIYDFDSGENHLLKFTFPVRDANKNKFDIEIIYTYNDNNPVDATELLQD